MFIPDLSIDIHVMGSGKVIGSIAFHLIRSDKLAFYVVGSDKVNDSTALHLVGRHL